MNSLFVYGTLQPGHSNAHILENIGGEWLAGYVKGTFTHADGVPRPISRIVLDEHGARVDGYLFVSDNLETHWAMLDEFEEVTTG
jgi:gamma-glutamylcyclotransferase (GGCT)/AIG2-like uncharacterized protein YtfP